MTKSKKKLEFKFERTIPVPQGEVYGAWLNPKIAGNPWNMADKLILQTESGWNDRVGRPVTGSAPPQNRTCGFPAYGSSERVGLQPSVRRKLGVADPDSRRHQRVLFQENLQVLPSQPSLLAPLR